MKLTFDFTQLDPSCRLFYKVVEAHIKPLHTDTMLIEINENATPPTISLTTNQPMEKAVQQVRRWIGKLAPLVVDLKAPFTLPDTNPQVPASLELDGKSE